MKINGRHRDWSLTEAHKRVFRVALTLLLVPMAAGAAGPPQVLSGLAWSVTTDGAMLSGAVNPNGRTTAAWFEWTVPVPAMAITLR